VEVPRLGEVALDGWAVGVTVVAAVAVAVVVGLLAHLVMRTGSAIRRSVKVTSGGSLPRNALVACQVGLTTVLICVGAALLRTVTTLQAVDLGFEPDGVASTRVMLADDRYAVPEARRAAWRALLDELEAREVDAAIGTNAPMAGVNMPWGHRVDPTEEQAFAQYHIVSPGYFELLGIEVLEGRAFSGQDDAGGAPVVIVNEALARAEFGDRSAVGERIEVVADEKVIVGVVEGTRHEGPDVDVPREIYAPYPQDPWPHAQLLVSGSPGAASLAVSAAADAVDPGLGLAPLEPYDRFVREWYAGLRLQLLIVGVLAAVGLLLATLGLYALVAYRVSALRREIGVRMALGASGGVVFSRLLRQGMAVVGIGLAAGLGVWYLAAPRAEGWLDGVRFTDPWIPAVVLLFVAATSSAAIGIPARRSVSVDPSTALREE
jgi:predicted permease